MAKNNGPKTQYKTFLSGRLMNRFLLPVYKNFLKKIEIKPREHILDVGCGGGALLNYFYRKQPRIRLYGLDPSKKMIDLSRKTNRRANKSGRLQLLQGSAMDIPGPDNHFDLVTAMETLAYWPDADLGLYEVNRVLSKGGRFIIINHYPSRRSKRYERMPYKDTLDYKRILTLNGFEMRDIDIHSVKGWIFIEAEKISSAVRGQNE